MRQMSEGASKSGQGAMSAATCHADSALPLMLYGG
jgi:hypothetical protein